MDAKTQNIPVLSSWRGVLAVCIFLFHFGFKQEFCQLTWSGVVFFFVSSGFLLTVRHDGAEMTEGGVFRFWLARAMRLYPAHWLALLMFAVLAVLNGVFVPKAWPMAVNVLLLQTYVPVQECFFSYNVLSWFLSALLLCYGLYPLLTRVWTHAGLVVLWSIVVAWFCLNVAAISLADVEEVKNYLYVCPLERVGEFALGMTLGQTWLRVGQAATKRQAWCMETCAWGCLAAFAAVQISWEAELEWYDATVMWWLPVGLLVWTMASCNGVEGPVGRLLLTRPFRFLGKISFELYLYQAAAPMLLSVTMLPVVYHFTGVTLGHHNFWFVSVSVVSQTALSWLLHKWFTKPYWRWCSRRMGALAGNVKKAAVGNIGEKNAL